MSRKKSRELAMKLLYRMSISKENYNELMSSIEENIEKETLDDENINIQDTDIVYIEDIIKGVEENRELIDKEIERNLFNWKIERLSKIDLAIMRISTYEILFKTEIPNSVSINEAIELAKKYSDDKSAAFINGVLDKIIKSK